MDYDPLNGGPLGSNARYYIRCRSFSLQGIWLRLSAQSLHSPGQLVLNFSEPPSSASVPPRPLNVSANAHSNACYCIECFLLSFQGIWLRLSAQSLQSPGQFVFYFGEPLSSASVPPRPLKFSQNFRSNARFYIECRSLSFQEILLRLSAQSFLSPGQLVLNFGEPPSSASVPPGPLKLSANACSNARYYIECCLLSFQGIGLRLSAQSLHSPGQLVFNFGEPPSSASVPPGPLKLSANACLNADYYIECRSLSFQGIWLRLSASSLHSPCQLVLNFGEPPSSASVPPRPLKLSPLTCGKTAGLTMTLYRVPRTIFVAARSVFKGSG